MAAKTNDRGSLILNDDNDESRRTVEQCYRTRKTIINPIVDWLEEDVWEFLNTVAKVPHCELYDKGNTRLGCLGCPMQNGRDMIADLDRYPKYKAAYFRAFQRMIDNRTKDGNKSNGADWTTPEDVYAWWTRSGPKPMRDYYQMEVDDD